MGFTIDCGHGHCTPRICGKFHFGHTHGNAVAVESFLGYVQSSLLEWHLIQSFLKL